jgi:hypothetical protein
MTVYLVMGVTPEGVFATMEAASAHITDLLAFTNLPSDYYRILKFEVQ